MPSALGYPQVQMTTPEETKQATPAPIPFVRAAKRHAEQGATQNNPAPWVATQQQFLVPPYGFLSALYMTIAATGGTGSAVAAGADAPWNVASHILLAHVNGTAFSGGAPALATTLEALMRSEPASADAFGQPQQTKPPASGSISYWTSQSFQVAAGSNTLLLTRVGNLIRNQILVFRDAGGSRANADSTGVTPTVLEYQWDGSQRYILNVDTLRELAYEYIGYDADAGVIPLQNTLDNDGIPINESGNEWMQTLGSTKLGLRFASAAAGTLQVITTTL